MLQAQKGVSEPSLSRKRRVPPGQEVGCSVGFNHETVKDLYRQQYYEILDFTISAINDHFNQPGYHILVSLENLLMKAARREDYQEDMKVVLDTYSDDFNPSRLKTQLELLSTKFGSQEPGPSMKDIKAYFASLSPCNQVFMSELCTALNIIQVIPATNAVSGVHLL